MRLNRSIIISIALILPLLCFSLFAPDAYAGGISPTTHQGQKWRIGYYEGGPYIDYQTELKAIVKGLAKLGWLSATEFPHFSNNETTHNLWHFLSSEIESEYIEFVRDAYWSSGWNDPQREKYRADVFLRLNKRKDIDLMIAAGTWAGKDLANHIHSVPTIVISTTDPIQAKIIKSATDSGHDHVFARCDPHRYVRQLRMFYNIFNFKTLGTVFANSEYGRIWAALGDAETVANENGIRLIKCAAPDSDEAIGQVLKNTKNCFNEMAPNIEAFYFNDHRGMNPKYMPDILAPFLKHGIYTWSLLGSDAVKRGVLMSIARANAEVAGDFQATVIAKILNGSRPGDLNQIFEDPKKIAINLETAKIIGYKVPWTILNTADEIYETIDAR